MNASSAQKNQTKGLKVWVGALGEYMPTRTLKTKEEFDNLFVRVEELLIDATENSKQRPSNKEDQKKYYSGKKSHTLKTILIATKDKYIKYLSPSCYGKTHDYSFFKQLFSPKVKWFENCCVLVDSGFQGFGKDYQTKKLFLPQKRKKNGDLTENQKNGNKKIAQKRIFVENSISGMKRYRILINKIRLHIIDLYDEIISCYKN